MRAFFFWYDFYFKFHLATFGVFGTRERYECFHLTQCTIYMLWMRIAPFFPFCDVRLKCHLRGRDEENEDTILSIAIFPLRTCSSLATIQKERSHDKKHVLTPPAPVWIQNEGRASEVLGPPPPRTSRRRARKRTRRVRESGGVCGCKKCGRVPLRADAGGRDFRCDSRVEASLLS